VRRRHREYTTRRLSVWDVLDLNRRVDNVMAEGQMSAEKAAEIMNKGKVNVRGQTIHVFKPNLSELPAVTIDDVMDTDIIVERVTGSINGTYGKSYVAEVGKQPGLPTGVLFINEDGVMGQQLKRFIDEKMLPMWAHVRQGRSANGNVYHTFDIPSVVSLALPQRTNGADDSPGLEDLPF